MSRSSQEIASAAGVFESVVSQLRRRASHPTGRSAVRACRAASGLRSSSFRE